MIIVACISFLLSPWKIAEHDFESGKLRRRTAKWRYIVEMAFVNSLFLVVRLVIVFKYEKDESIFVARNGIAIILGIIQLRNLELKGYRACRRVTLMTISKNPSPSSKVENCFNQMYRSSSTRKEPVRSNKSHLAALTYLTHR